MDIIGSKNTGSRKGKCSLYVLSVIEKCVKCGFESEQKFVYSVNFSLGKREDNEKLINHMQVCPNCNYKAPRISFSEEKDLNPA